MKRNKYKDYLWYTALAVFIVCVIEGIFFYAMLADYPNLVFEGHSTDYQTEACLRHGYIDKKFSACWSK